MRQRTLLIGAPSPLGRAIGDELVARRHNVHGISRSGADGTERLDVTDPVQTLRMLRNVRPTRVVHLARPDLPDDPVSFIDATVEALHRFALQCAEVGVERFVFASSAGVYGTAAAEPLKETDATPAPTPYSQLKLRSEQALADAATSSGLATLSLRIFNAYGPGLTGSLTNRLVLGDTAPPVVRVIPHFVRDYIHSTDIALAVGLALESGKSSAQVVNVGTGIGTSNTELLALCPRAEYRSSNVSGAQSCSVADIGLARTLWGFAPRVRLKEALRRPGSLLA